MDGGDRLLVNCRDCSIELTKTNAAKNGMRNGKARWRNQCRLCASNRSIEFDNNHKEIRKIRVNNWARKIGKVKKYPCEQCDILCYKEYKKAFCSDMCRFLFYVEKTDNCWLWNGAKHKTGYGKLCFQGNKTDTAHRVSFKLFKGPIEDGLYACHTCDNPSCVNPDHLWLGTAQDNKTDQIEKERGLIKLFPMDVVKIRELWGKSGWSNKKLCEEFNVTATTISNIIKRKLWKHV